MAWRNESASKAPKRETRFLPALMSIHTHVWKAVFGKPADAIEKSVENADECEFIACLLQVPPLMYMRRHDHRQRPTHHPPHIRSKGHELPQLFLIYRRHRRGSSRRSRLRTPSPSLARLRPGSWLLTVGPRDRPQHAHRPASEQDYHSNQAREVGSRARRGTQDLGS